MVQARVDYSKWKGRVVQSVVSLTSLLKVISLTVLTDWIYNIQIFFAEKMWVAFALQKLLTFFQQKISAYLHITQLDVNVISFEQLGPAVYVVRRQDIQYYINPNGCTG